MYTIMLRHHILLFAITVIYAVLTAIQAMMSQNGIIRSDGHYSPLRTTHESITQAMASGSFLD